MKHKLKRVLSLVLALCMVLSLTCINVYAASETEPEVTVTDTAEEASEEAASESVEAEPEAEAEESEAAAEEEQSEAEAEESEAETESEAESEAEAEVEDETEEDVASDEALISVASEEGTAETTALTASSGTTKSVTVYTSGTSTATFTSTSELSISGGTVYNSDNTAIATYTVSSSTVTTYGSYTVTSSVASSVSANSYYVIGDSSSGYLTVDSSGNLSTSTTVNEYSIWKVVSASSSYYLYNEATGYYLRLANSGGSYSLSTTTSTSGNDSRTAFSYSSSNGCFCITAKGQNSSTTYYYINGTSASSSSGSSVYAVTLGDATTTYVYTITFTGVTKGTGSVTIDGTTYNVTVKEVRTFTSGSQSINLSYGWHIANIESVKRETSGQGPDSSSSTTEGYAAVTASQSALSSLYSQKYLTAGDTNVYGWDEDIYGEYDESGNYDLHLTVYGSDDQETWTEIDMTQSTGTTGSGTSLVGAYDGNTIYDYYYIMIVPDDGYYVSQLVAACNDTNARQTSTYSDVTTVVSYTEVYGSEYIGVYGVGCSTMGSGNSFEAGYEPTAGTSIVLDMKTVLAKHYEAGGSLGAEDPYFVLIELAEIPTPLYVEYEAGTGDSYITADAIVDTTGSYYWANSYVNDGYNAYSSTDEKKNSASFVLSKSELQELGYQYQVLNPSVTEYTVTENGEDVTYYFTGWAVTYYTTATGTYDETIDGESGYYCTAENGTAQYPYLSGELDMVSSDIEYGSNTSIYLFTHVKLVAQWTTEKLDDVGYVVDFGLPVELNIIDQCVDANSDYTWTISSIGTYPSYGSAVVGEDSKTITYTPTSVITDATTMTVNLTGTPTGSTASGTITAVVNVTIYPATTVYYEEGFATYGNGWSVDTCDTWGTTTNKGSENQQTHIANSETSYNNYNYDSAYANDTGASDGTAASTITAQDSLTFTFTGTGVDIFANCDSGSGIVAIKVVDASETTEKMLTVNMADIGSYASGGTAYNTPIASVSDLEHGKHTVTIYLSSASTNGFKFDGFRVYGTIDVKEGSDVEAVYTADDEDYPVYYELRNNVLAGLKADTDSSTYKDDIANEVAQVYATGEVPEDGAIVVYDSNSGLLRSITDDNGGIVSTTVQDLLDDGPKNELYLYQDMSVVFKITTNREVQIGLRSVTGASVTYTINGTEYTTSSSVDMFYDLQAKSSSGATETTYTITVTSGGILSITDIKVSDCNDASIFGSLTADEVVAALTGSTSDADEDEDSTEDEDNTEDQDNTEDEEEPAVFEPETFTVSTSAKANSKSATVTVTVKTSEDVESITVNGTEVTSYKTVTERSGGGKDATTTTYRQFTYTETVTASGTYTYEVTAVNADGVASTATTATATVTLRSNGNRR